MTNDIDYRKLGQRIKYYRVKCHLTQEQLAANIDVATSSVSHAERGTSKPSLPMLIKIANALKISIDQLLCDNLPIEDVYLDKDIASLLSDCSTRERRIIRDIIEITKKTIRENS